MFTLFVIVLVIGQCLAESHPWIAEPKDAYWLNKHEHYVNMTLEHGKDAKLIFIGDSITEGWKQNGRDVWRQHYAPRHAYNYGVGGDRTQNVLYRIEHKELDGLNPKVAVLMIGTNNIAGNTTVEDIAHGVQEIVRQMEVKMPETKVVLLGVLPRPEPWGSKIKKLNVLLKKLSDEKRVYWLDMWLAFESADGKQKTELFVPADHVHLVAAGYEVWAKTMDPLLKKLYPSY